jgi:hypothetical protein
MHAVSKALNRFMVAEIAMLQGAKEAVTVSQQSV